MFLVRKAFCDTAGFVVMRFFLSFIIFKKHISRKNTFLKIEIF